MQISLGFPVDTMVKNLPTLQEMQVRFLGQGDPLEEEMAAYSSILTWEIPWTEEPCGLQSKGSRKSQTQLSEYTTTITKHF